MSKADKLLKRIEFYEKMASTQQKSENDDLLKKASLFEKLALYSDRKSFLHAIAQDPGAAAQDPNAANRQLINQALQILQQAGVDEATTAPLGNAVLFNKVDLPAIQRAIQTATLTKMSPLTHQAQINQLRQISSQLKAPLTPDQEEAAKAMAGPADMVFKDDRLTALKPINPADQLALLKFVKDENLGQLDESKFGDGKLGKETRKALNLVKDYFVRTYPQSYPNRNSMSDQQAIQAAKTPKR